MSDSENAKRLFFEALALMDSSNFEGAERRLREALRFAPANEAVLTNLAVVLLQFGRHAEALDSYERAIAIQPDHGPAHVNRGNALRRLKRYDEAVAAYDRALALNPNLPPAWLNRGNALYDLGRHQEALAVYDRALALDAGLAPAWLGRGNVMSKLQRHDEALEAFQQALTRDPNSAEAWVGLGNVLQHRRNHDEALGAYAKALACKPDLSGAWFGRGNVFYDRKRYDEALAAYDKAVALDGDFAGAWIGRGNILRQLRRSQEAIDAYRQALRLGGDAESISYYLASLGAEPSPAGTPGRFVASLFDSFADTFDHELVTNLKYQMPALLAEAIKQQAPRDALDILDMGCGTGLAGEQVLPFKRTLTGVDLSSNMLEKARQRGIYDRLECADLVEFLQAHERAFDLAIAADVFVYLGDLSSVFQAVRRALRDGGLFCFSVEAVKDGDFVLRNTLRYAHSIGYLRALAERNRFAVAMIEPRVIRMDLGSNIDGYVAMMRCT